MAEPLDAETTKALDTLFQAWLALNGMVNKKGVLYRADAKGVVMCDNKNVPLRVAPASFNQLMNDPKRGFEAFVAKKGIQVKAVQRAFPKK